MIVREQLNLGFGIGEKDEKIRNFLGSQTEREIKKEKYQCWCESRLREQHRRCKWRRWWWCPWSEGHLDLLCKDPWSRKREIGRNPNSVDCKSMKIWMKARSLKEWNRWESSESEGMGFLFLVLLMDLASCTTSSFLFL